MKSIEEVLKEKADSLRFELYEYCDENNINHEEVTSTVVGEKVEIDIWETVPKEHYDALYEIAKKYDVE